MLNSDLVKSCTTNTCDFYVCRGMPLLLSHWQINFKHFLYQFKLLEADDGVIPSVTTKALKKNPVAMDIPMNNPTASAIIKSCTILIFQSKNPAVVLLPPQRKQHPAFLVDYMATWNGRQSF